MKAKSNQLLQYLFFLIIIILLFFLVWLNSSLLNRFPQESNFLRPWSALNSFIEFGNDPYSDQVTNQSQKLYYGKLVESDTNPLILDQAFVPVILYFPFALIKDYTIARVLYMTILEIALISIPLLCISLWEWKPSRLILILFVLFTVLSPPFIQSLIKLDPVIFIVFLILVGLICIKKGYDEFAGASFAIVIFQPSVSGLLMTFILYWLIRNRRWKVLWGWVMMFGLFLVVSLALVPNWIPSFVKAFRIQSGYNGYVSPFSIFSEFLPGIGGKLATALSLLSIIIILYEWVIMKSSDFKWVLWSLVFTISTSSIIGLPYLRNYLVILIIPLSYFFVGLAKRYMPGRNRTLPVLGFLFIFLFIWGAYNFGYNERFIKYLNFFLFILCPIILNFGLYSIRWWSVKYLKSRLILSD